MALSNINISTSSLSAAIRGYGKAKAWQRALSLLGEMSVQTIRRSQVTFNVAITACREAKQWWQVLQLLASMAASRVERDQITFNAAISACEKAGQWSRALALLAEMASAWLQHDTISYSSAVSACEKGGQWSRAISLLCAMFEVRVERNTVVFSAGISALEKGGQWELALSVLSSMQAAMVERNTITFSAAISACEKCGRYRHALGLLDSMASARVSANVITFNAAVSACEKASRWDGALALLGRLRLATVQCNAVSFNAAIGACSHAGRWLEAMGLLAQMLELRLPPSGIAAGEAVGGVHASLGRSAAVETLRNVQEAVRRAFPERPRRAPPTVATRSPQVLCCLHGIVATCKPAGLSTEDTLDQLSVHLGVRLRAVSRLDLPTSGVLPAAVGSAGLWWLQALWSSHLVNKDYVCLCAGPTLGPVGAKGVIRKPLRALQCSKVSSEGRELRFTKVDVFEKELGGRDASSEYEVLAVYRSPACTADEHVLSLLRVRPLTGRTHQIRVHLASIGRPLVGDSVYNQGPCASPEWCPRLFLHCQQLSLLDLMARPVSIRAPLAPELSTVLALLQQAA